MFCTVMRYIIITIFILSSAVLSFGQNVHDYKNCSDPIKKEITIDKNLDSEFFKLLETSYPWYIIPKDDGTFESADGTEINEEDTIPIEHTSNCVSTHQGEHKMDFCNATMESDQLQMEIYGGLPAYASSLMIQIKDSKFKCLFKATYPAPVEDLKWKILSKELKVKSSDFKKNERLYAWISVIFEETSTFQGKHSKSEYKIEGYLKPIIK